MKKLLILLFAISFSGCISLKKHQAALDARDVSWAEGARKLWVDGRDKGAAYARAYTRNEMGAKKRKAEDATKKYYKAWRRCEDAGPAYLEK